MSEIDEIDEMESGCSVDDEFVDHQQEEIQSLRALNAELVEALERLESKLAGNMRNVRVGDYVKVRYKGGNGSLEGTVTRIWKPSEHRGGMWQGQVNNGWCFHAHDELVEHEETEGASND